MRADLELKQKLPFWETPRNIGILVTIVCIAAAALFGDVGFELGQRSQMQPLQVRFPPGTVITIPAAPAPTSK